MSLKKYRLIDLSRLLGLALLVEIATALVFYYTKLPRFYISITAIVVRIARIRWNAIGLAIGPIAGVIGQMLRSLLRGEYPYYGFLITTIPYLFLAICLLFFSKEGFKKKREGNFGYLTLYALSGYLSLEAGQLLCEIGNTSYYSQIGLQRGADLIQILVGIVIFFAAYRQGTILRDRKTRFLEKKKQNETARRREEKFDYYRLEERAEGNDVNDAALLEGGTLSTEDLKKRESDRRKIENRKSFFDKENEADRKCYGKKKNKGGETHGS